MSSFPDLRNENLGQREQLFNGKYLFYQPAETNTSIREGWYYRNDTKQKTRSTDDVFDIYERSVGGNSYLLLNIPPNREGTFSPTDVKVLKETRERIRETYGNNLLDGAKGPKNILDNDDTTFELLSGCEGEMIVEAPQAVTISHYVIQEAITTHSERIEKHALDAWIDNDWKEIATATNVGYKRILRFPEVNSNKFRIRVWESRLTPAISSVSAHYYKTRPPQLEITRDIDGQLSIQSKKQAGSVAAITFGIIKKDCKLLNADSERSGNEATKPFDGDANTYWHSLDNNTGSHSLAIDLGETYLISGFTYSPQQKNSQGMIEKGSIETSPDGKTWNKQS